MKILNLKAVVLLVFVFVIHTTKGQTSENVQKLTDYITNGQLVIYSESSYLSDTMASAITYVDFCPNNRYHYSYDGSYTVKGTENTSNRDNRGYGAGVASNSGMWQVLEYLGGYYLEILDYNNQPTYYPIQVQNLISGKWKVNKTTYVFAQGKGRCP